MEDTFNPRRSIAERYSLDNMSKQAGMTVDEFKIKIANELKLKQDMIDKQISKGMSFEQAETHVLRCLYIAGFSGPTFRD